MSEIECPQCGAGIRVVPESGETQVSLTCPGCRASLRVQIETAPSGHGLETIFQPQLLSEGFAETAIIDGSGTLQLKPEELRQARGPLDLKLKAYLVVVGDPEGHQHPVAAPKTTVGREGADIAVGDPALSGRHFEIEVLGEEFFLRDLDSRNGTMLNGSSIRATELVAGDKIRAGRTTFLFQTQEVIPMGEGWSPERR
jgi:hypothetical protein